MTEGTEEEEYRFAFVVALLLVVRFWGVTYNFDLSDVRFWSAYEWLSVSGRAEPFDDQAR